MIPIPIYLATYAWYAPQCARVLSAYGECRHDPGDAVPRRADLRRADLRRAGLGGADLRGADLRRAIMPDGRTWADYTADPLAGICDDPEARARATAAWEEHTWEDCPMHAAHGWTGVADAPAARRIAVAAFVALFDARLLDDYPTRSGR